MFVENVSFITAKDPKMIPVTGHRFSKNKSEQVDELLTEEAPLQIKVNGKAYTITMRTPGKDRELAIGLLFTEGIVHSASDVVSINEELDDQSKNILAIDIEIPASLIKDKNLFNRSIASSASCGVCGKIDICDVVPITSPIKSKTKIDIKNIQYLFEQMMAMQGIFEQTGGTHAAAIFTHDGQLLSIQEDIGRHNATDKAIGELFLKNELHHACFLCISGRVSFEIASKCAKASIPVLAAVSAPSSMAVRYCQDMNIVLLAFCRGERATAYTRFENIHHYELIEQND
jgi:FdhD protein